VYGKLAIASAMLRREARNSRMISAKGWSLSARRLTEARKVQWSVVERLSEDEFL
jgi:hypothetical protein